MATACGAAAAAITSCENATASWDNLPASKQASCICYDGTSWSPDRFDGPVLTCANYAKTADPTDYSSIAALESFCAKEGDVRSPTAGSTTAAKSAATVSVTPAASPTQLVVTVLTLTNSLTPTTSVQSNTPYP